MELVLGRRNYEFMLGRDEPNEGQYREALAEVEAVFSNRVDPLSPSITSRGQFNLRPAPHEQLIEHPIAVLLHLEVRRAISELHRMGRDQESWKTSAGSMAEKTFRSPNRDCPLNSRRDQLPRLKSLSSLLERDGKMNSISWSTRQCQRRPGTSGKAERPEEEL